MPAKVCPKLLIEGACSTLRTQVAAELSRDARIVGAPRAFAASPLVSAEWGGLVDGPPSRGLIDFELEEKDRAMEAFATWARLFELLRYSPWLVDRFHLSTVVHQGARGREPDFGWLEQRLRPLGFRVILCTQREGALTATGPGERERLLTEQAALRRAAEDSILPCLELDLSDQDTGSALHRVAAWLSDTGGLCPPWVNDVWLGTSPFDPLGAAPNP